VPFAFTRSHQADMSRSEIALFASALALVGLFTSVAGAGFPLDDSWIYQSAARTLATNGEWALLPGQPGAAVTSPLFTLLLAIGYKLGVNHLLWTHLLGASALGLQAILMARLAVRAFPGLAAGGWIAGLLSISTWQLVWAAASGMETALFCLLTTGLIYFAWHMPTGDTRISVFRGAAAFGILAGLTILTRPEGAVLAGLAWLAMWLGKSRRPRALAQSLLALLVCALVIAPSLAINFQQTGALLPQTATAKLAQFSPLTRLQLSTRIANIVLPVLAGGQVLLLPGALVFLWRLLRKRNWRSAAPFALPCLGIAALVLIYATFLPAGYHHGRYLIPALPSLILAGSIGLASALTGWTRTRWRRVIAKSWLLACLSCSVIFVLFIAPSIFRRDVAIVNEEMVAAASWVAENVPHTETLAAHDIGALSYFARRLPIDISGLSDRDVLAVIADASAIWDLLADHDVEYLIAFPIQIPDFQGRRQMLCPVYVSEGKEALRAGGVKMVVYRLAWNGDC